MSPGRAQPGVQKPKQEKKPIVPTSCPLPKNNIIRDGKCYTREEYYGKRRNGNTTSQNQR